MANSQQAERPRPGRKFQDIDLGFDPPLSAGTRRHALDDRRNVSIRWLSATILTGLFGAGLMGVAVMGALHAGRDAAEKPEFAANSPQRPPAGSADSQTARKGDKLIRAVDLISAKKSFKTPTVTRVNDREVIKVRAFARVSSPLVLASTGFREDVPVFNALKLLTDGGAERAADLSPGAADDSAAEVSLASLDLASFNPSALHQAALSDADAFSQARELMTQPRRSTGLLVPPQMMLARAMRPPPGIGVLNYAPEITSAPFSRLEVRMVPENVTAIPKSEASASQTLPEEKVLTIKRGESAETVLRGAGAAQQTAKTIAAALTGNGRDRTISEGHRLKVLHAPLEPGGPRQLVRVMLYTDETLEAISAVNDKGSFVAVAIPAEQTAAREEADEAEQEGEGGIRLYNSIYETALKNEISKPVIDDLVRIFSYDLDYQRRVSGGDTLEVLYSEDDDVDSKAGDVLFTSITVGGENRRFYRFLTPDDSVIDYYDDVGRSAKKFLIRKPILSDAPMRSGFGMRRHPILGYSKMHTGIDWADRVGTPIVSAGNGSVIKAEWDSGYGRRVEIQHVNGYVSAYSHMSAFARGIQPGTKVRQGQVIGFLGSSGLATGPHLHYELIINDRYVDPMRVKLPRGRELDGRMLAEFRRERDRIDQLLKKAPNQTRVAQQ